VNCAASRAAGVAQNAREATTAQARASQPGALVVLESHATVCAPRAALAGDARAYTPRHPEETVLYTVVREQLETFLARARARERPVPRFVERELRAFLGCGILAHGFVRLRCGACGQERLVAFSCKGRGFCPSCGGRRMDDTAAHLVDRVLPEVPVRQWVLSLPFALRYRLAYDARLASLILAVFVRTVFASLRRRARRQWGLTRSQCGAVTFVQRFGDALNLNLHFHSLVLDGVYARGPEGRLRFHPLPAPDDAEVARVARRVARAIARRLERQGLGPGADACEADPLAADEPLLSDLYAASVQGRVATGPRAGQRTRRVGDRIDPDELPQLAGERCASVAGVSLHANVAVPARDRRRLERLCRYVARPPVATERLSRLPDGQLLYRLKHRWRDGTTHVVFDPLELVEKLAALVPPPRFHLVRYHGIFGPCASARDAVVPGAEEVGVRAAPPADADAKVAEPSPAADRRPIEPLQSGAPRATTGSPDGVPSSVREEAADLPALRRSRRLSWPELMRRVFAIEVLECPRCGGAMKILAAIHPPETTAAILACLGLPTRAPPTEPARAEVGAAPQDSSAADW
jgi:hypothetical protein